MDTFVILAQLKLRTRQVHVERKKENIVPVCKMGDKQYIGDSSPVCSLSDLGKNNEKFIFREMFVFYRKRSNILKKI